MRFLQRVVERPELAFDLVQRLVDGLRPPVLELHAELAHAGDDHVGAEHGKLGRVRRQRFLDRGQPDVVDVDRFPFVGSVQEDLEADDLAVLDVDRVVVRVVDGAGNRVLARLQERGLGPAADGGVPPAAALALLLHHREADEAVPADRDIRAKGPVGHPVLGHVGGGDGRPAPAGKGELQTMRSAGGVLGRKLDPGRRLLALRVRQLQVRPRLQVGLVLEVEQQRFPGFDPGLP